MSKTYSGVQALENQPLNIITGVTKPTHKVFMNGYDIEEDIAEIQRVCSQDDYLWDELTAKEHMILTAIFKGIKFGPELSNAVEFGFGSTLRWK